MSSKTSHDPSPVPRKLPIGIQTLRSIREGGHYYVDKTAHVGRLVDEGSRYFLSRPRRFGKSLVVDTLAELFQGSEELFRGLAVHRRWDWSARHPVLKLDFAGGDFSTTERLEAEVREQLASCEESAGIEARPTSDTGGDPAPARLRRLVRDLHAAGGSPVVVLVDEYDKPILDNLRRPDVARSNRDFLSGLYGTFKACDADIRFLMLTGVSKFSKVNLFSGLNNLEDITLDPRFATICGYTETELDRVFAPELEGLDRDAIREWYNGYSWLGDEPVYNPFDILLLFRNRRFRPYWFETGTPAFLVDTLTGRGTVPLDLEHMVVRHRMLSEFDVERIGTAALLFQTGYLTIRGTVRSGGLERVRLSYPNQEVRQALNEVLLPHLVAASEESAQKSAYEIEEALAEGDAEALRDTLTRVLAGIPYEWHSRSTIARHEAYYASVVYAYLASLGAHVTVEDSGSRGRADITARWAGRVYIFEFKVVEDEPEGQALAQIRDRGYADKYRGLGEPIHLVGIEFSRRTRNIAAFETETA